MTRSRYTEPRPKRQIKKRQYVQTAHILLADFISSRRSETKNNRTQEPLVLAAWFFLYGYSMGSSTKWQSVFAISILLFYLWDITGMECLWPLARLKRRWNPSQEYRERHRGRQKVHSRNLLITSVRLLQDDRGKSALFHTFITSFFNIQYSG